ncbi:hypothetical protein MG293_009873 [Ovis ammon polii]|uniref:Uncharacterized protein n=1 Tax=Ovis ammon polii TaxID=230172 RepID=A0AAD4U9Y1_OVIAM|nr:hypothetical protein MG293_009873 [Ovis ammon polii]
MCKPTGESKLSVTDVRVNAIFDECQSNGHRKMTRIVRCKYQPTFHLFKIMPERLRPSEKGQKLSGTDRTSHAMEHSGLRISRVDLWDTSSEDTKPGRDHSLSTPGHFWILLPLTMTSGSISKAQDQADVVSTFFNKNFIVRENGDQRRCDVTAADRSECLGAGFEQETVDEKGSKTQPEPRQMFTHPPVKEAEPTTFSDAEFTA